MSLPEFTVQFVAAWQTAPFFNKFMIAILFLSPLLFAISAIIVEKVFDIEV